MVPPPLCRPEKGWWCSASLREDYLDLVTVGKGLVGEDLRLFVQLSAIPRGSPGGTDWFILALVRFVDRRGEPKEIYSHVTQTLSAEGLCNPPRSKEDCGLVAGKGKVVFQFSCIHSPNWRPGADNLTDWQLLVVLPRDQVVTDEV